MNSDVLQHRPSSDEINAMPLFRYEGPVHLVRSLADLKAAMPFLLAEDILGFDTETRPSFRKGKQNSPSLIQLATSDSVFLIQLSWIPLTQALTDIFADSTVVKAGVAVAEDMRELKKLFHFTPAGLADVGEYAKANGMSSHGLRTLAANLFGLRISKGPQCSNWSLKMLSQRQIIYAATDAWISRNIYIKMQDLGLIPQITPE